MSSAQQQIEVLLSRAHAGDRDAVDALLLLHRPRLRRMVALRLDRRVAVRVDPSDVVQDALLLAHRRLPEFLRDRAVPFYPWLRRIAWERVLQIHEKHLKTFKRSARNEERIEGQLSGESIMALAGRLSGRASQPHAGAVRREERTRVRRAIERLAESDREFILLHYVEQMSITEIAALLKIGASAAKMRHVRALEQLREAFTGT